MGVILGTLVLWAAVVFTGSVCECVCLSNTQCAVTPPSSHLLCKTSNKPDASFEDVLEPSYGGLEKDRDTWGNWVIIKLPVFV